MSIFHNSCTGSGGSGGTGVSEEQLQAALDAAAADIRAGTADPLPVGTIIKVHGSVPAPAGYEFVDGLAAGSYDQGEGSRTNRVFLGSSTNAPVGADTSGFRYAQGNYGDFLYEVNAGTIAATSVLFRPIGREGGSVFGLDAWPTELQAEGARRILAFDIVAEYPLIGTLQVVAFVASLTRIYAMSWIVEGFTWTLIGSDFVELTVGADAVPQCPAYLVDGSTLSVGVRVPNSDSWLVLDANMGTLELLPSASFANNPGFAAMYCLSSREDGRAVFGSLTDNVVRARRMSIIDDGGRKVASAYKSTLLPIAGITTSASAVVVRNQGDSAFSILAPGAVYSVSIPEADGSPSVVKQVAGRHPQVGNGEMVPLSGAFISPLQGIFAARYYEKKDANLYEVYELNLEPVSYLNTFYRYARKTNNN